MTDTPTPPAMTPEQRAKLTIVGFDLAREGCDESAVIAWTDGRAVFFEGDQLAVVLALTAERDAAQAEIARLTAALATAREDGMREALDCLPALIKSEWDEGTDSHAPNRCHLTVRENMGVRAAGSRIKAAIQKGDAT